MRRHVQIALDVLCVAAGFVTTCWLLARHDVDARRRVGRYWKALGVEKQSLPANGPASAVGHLEVPVARRRG